MYSKLIKKITTVLLLISLFAIQFPTYAFAAVNGDRKTVPITYTYSEIVNRKQILEEAKNAYDISKITNANTRISIAFAILLAKYPKIAWVGQASGISFASTAALELDKVMGLQRAYSDLCDVYTLVNKTRDYMEKNKCKTVTFKQDYEFKVTRIFGDHTAEWYLDGNPYVSSYTK